jgi:hypothetical protein
MKPILVVTKTCWLGTCRSCGASIEWATVAESGRAMPFNRPLVLEPNLALEDGEPPVIARVDLTKTTPHFATCPQAAEWRRRRRR